MKKNIELSLKEAQELYRDLQCGRLKLSKNHNNDRIKTLPSGNGTYLEPKETLSTLKKSLEKFGNVLTGDFKHAQG